MSLHTVIFFPSLRHIFHCHSYCLISFQMFNLSDGRQVNFSSRQHPELMLDKICWVWIRWGSDLRKTQIILLRKNIYRGKQHLAKIQALKLQKEKENSCDDCEDKRSNINDTFLKIMYTYLGKFTLFGIQF